MCQKPDRHEPRLKCGHPLPCPWHNDEVLLLDKDTQRNREWAAKLLRDERSENDGD